MRRDRFLKLKFNATAIWEIDEIEFARICEAIAGVIVVGIADEGVCVRHLPESDALASEEFECDAPILPGFVAAAPVFTVQIVLREFVTKIIFHTGTTGHEISPEDVFANIVQCVRSLSALGDAAEAHIPRIRRDTKIRWTL